MNRICTLQLSSKLFTILFLVFVLEFSVSAQVTHDISVTSNEFTPSELTIAVGDEVVWTNNEGFHNVNGTQDAYPDNPESFGNSTGSGWTYSYTFNTPGVYQYHCDPHLSLGMTGTITVVEDMAGNSLTVNFSNMSPHVDQDLYLRVVDKATGEEIDRVNATITENFSVEAQGIVPGSSYTVEFFADFNENGVYDAPPADHAWSLDLDNVSGDESLDFSHNTDFTDIGWQYRLHIDFFSMTPHVGQELVLFLYDVDAGSYADTISLEEIPSAEFSVDFFGITPGSSYFVDFYADFNQNGMYDAPPADHAWRINVPSVNGDENIEFTHNTNFTDISSPTFSPEIAGNHSISIYPVPAGNFLNIELNESISGILSVYDLTGKKILEKRLSNSEYLMRMDVSEFEPGVYFIQLNTGSKINATRFIKK